MINYINKTGFEILIHVLSCALQCLSFKILWARTYFGRLLGMLAERHMFQSFTVLFNTMHSGNIWKYINNTYSNPTHPRRLCSSVSHHTLLICEHIQLQHRTKIHRCHMVLFEQNQITYMPIAWSSDIQVNICIDEHYLFYCKHDRGSKLFENMLTLHFLKKYL